MKPCSSPFLQLRTWFHFTLMLRWSSFHCLPRNFWLLQGRSDIQLYDCLGGKELGPVRKSPCSAVSGVCAFRLIPLTIVIPSLKCQPSFVLASSFDYLRSLRENVQSATFRLYQLTKTVVSLLWGRQFSIHPNYFTWWAGTAGKLQIFFKVEEIILYKHKFLWAEVFNTWMLSRRWGWLQRSWSWPAVWRTFSGRFGRSCSPTNFYWLLTSSFWGRKT